MNEDIRGTIYRLSEAESDRVKYDRSRSDEEIISLLSQGKWVEVPQTKMEKISSVVTKKGTAPRTSHGKRDGMWYISVLHPEKLK
jgi:hypothetical protein